MKNIRTCFLIEDDVDDIEIFAMALQQVDKNIDLQSASDCIMGLRVLEDRSFIPDYIFLDINMPKMNGIQCLPEIRKMEHLRDSKVIMYSTSSDEEIQRNTRQLGADHYLVKPSKLELLINHLHRILVKREL